MVAKEHPCINNFSKLLQIKNQKCSEIKEGKIESSCYRLAFQGNY